MKKQFVILASALTLGLASAAFAESPPPAAVEVGIDQLALKLFPAKSKQALRVSSPSFKAGGDIPFKHTRYRENIFPGLSWDAGPDATKSYVLIMQDTDLLRDGVPILHWTMFNIPAKVTELEVGLTTPPGGASFGPNIAGLTQSYRGPRTPVGPKHRYHFQIFALDTVMPEEPAPTWQVLADAMKGHVLASGEVIGLGQIDPSAPPDPPAAPAPAPAR